MSILPAEQADLFVPPQAPRARSRSARDRAKRLDLAGDAHPVLLEDGTDTHDGFGLMLKPYRGRDLAAHTGGVIGGASQMLKVVDHDLDIVIIAASPGSIP